MLNQTLNSRWFANLLLIGFGLLLALALLRLHGTPLRYQEASSHTSPAQTPVPVARLPNLFTPESWARHPGETNTPGAFATTYFTPVTPPPPPPTTRKIELTYRGYYQPDAGDRRVFLQMDQALVVGVVGQLLTTNLFIADATMQTITFTNPPAQTNVLKLNTKQVIEVPLQVP